MVWNTVPGALSKRFRVLEPFAHGGTGSMYLADESESGRRGLLKVLASVPKHREPERARLRRELTKQATLDGGHLVVPWASGESEGTTWLFRPWLDGVSLSVRLQLSARAPEGALRHGAGLPVLDALAVAAQLAAAMDELHRGGLLHRDLKPGHVFLQTNGHGAPRALLIESGVCGSLPRPGNSTIFGTPGYVAPEQLLGKLVSFRSDLYSLGCVMYEMLAGHPPFRAETDQATMAAQLTGELPPLPENLPGGIAGLLRSLLSREPQERPFSAQKLRRILDPYAPQGAPMTRQPTSTFATVPEADKKADKPAETAAAKPPPSLPPPPPAAAMRTTQSMFAPVAGGSSSVPAHRPAVRGVAPPPPPRPAKAARVDATQQVDLDQIEELTEAEAQDLTQELSPEHLEQIPAPSTSRSVPAPVAKPAVRQDHTVPVRLDQILSMAPAKLRASASASAPPPPLEPEPVAAPVAVAAAVVVSAPSAPAAERSLFEPAPRATTSYSPHGIDSTKSVDESNLTEAAPEQASLPAAQEALPPPSSSLFGALPEAQHDPLYEIAFGLADEDDSDDVEKTKIAPKPERPYSPAAASSSLDDDATRIHPASSRPPAARDDGDENLAPRALQDTLHPYLATTPKARRKLVMYGGAAAGLLLLVWGVSSLTGDDETSLAQREADKAPAAGVVAAAPPLPSPTVEPTPSVTALNEGVPTANEKPGAEAPKALPVEPAAAPSGPVAASPTPTVEPQPSVERRPVAEPRAAAAAPEKSSTSTRNAREDRRRDRREEKARAEAAKNQAKKSDASSDRAAKWAEARDQARAHYAAKRYKQAAQAYERASTFDPTNAGTFAGLGAARLQAGDAKGAVAAYQRAIQLSPSSAGFHVALGRAYVSAGDKAKAKASYKRALSIDPKYESATSSLRELGG